MAVLVWVFRIVIAIWSTRTGTIARSKNPKILDPVHKRRKKMSHGSWHGHGDGVRCQPPRSAWSVIEGAADGAFAHIGSL
jgi:hypothetical protein